MVLLSEKLNPMHKNEKKTGIALGFTAINTELFESFSLFKTVSVSFGNKMCSL